MKVYLKSCSLIIGPGTWFIEISNILFEETRAQAYQSIEADLGP